MLAAYPAAVTALATTPPPAAASAPATASPPPPDVIASVASVPAKTKTPPRAPGSLAGYANLHDPRVYNGLATPDRDRLDLDGLLPAGDASPELEVDRASAAVDACESPMQKYRQLVTLQNTDERAFYALLERRTAELLPILYTPTVGDACLQFGTLTPRPPGLYVSLNDLGAVDRVVARWPSPDVRVAVLTDGERILGLGDQGANGMGISAGKSMVYAACGVNPSWLLPVHVDNGTNNQRLLDDPLYVGLRRRRVRGDAYDRLLDETVAAIRARYGERTLAHWEDLAPRNAFEVLRRFQDPRRGGRTYNDDIQGTAAVTVAGLIASARVTRKTLRGTKVLFFGAGQANLGAAELLVRAATEEGASESEARGNIWLFDSRGLVVANRPLDPEGRGLSAEKRRFAEGEGRDETVTFTADLETAVRRIKPDALIGAAATPGAFTEGVVRAMREASPRPIIFALSNPTSKAECTARQAYEWSGGDAVFASGTKFAEVAYTPGGGGGGKKQKKNPRTFAPGFANNAFIFPGVALGSLASGASRVTDGMFLAAARALAAYVSAESLDRGAVYPPTEAIRDAAVVVGAAVAAQAEAEGVADEGACRGGGGSGGGGGGGGARRKTVPSLDGPGGGAADTGCTNWEACVREYLKTCA